MEYTAPLFELLKKENEFIWTENCASELGFIKNKLKKTEIPVRFQFVCLVIIYRDLSGKATGFVLA